VKAIRRAMDGALGFFFGFLFVLLFLSAINIFYRGVWLPAALAGVIGYLLAMLPRFAEGRLRLHAVGLFGTIATILWMATTARLPVSRGGELLRFVIPLFGLVAARFAISFWMAYRRSPEPSRPPLKWLFAVFAAGWIVAFFSSGKGGSDPMVAWAQHMLNLAPEQAEALVILVRKTIHLSFYAVTGLAAWRLARGCEASVERATMFALLAPLAISMFDELRQSTIAGRTGSIWDVLLDMVGAGAAVWLLRARDARGPASSTPRTRTI
jgi:VanZ family protein